MYKVAEVFRETLSTGPRAKTLESERPDVDSLEKILMLGGIGGRKRRGTTEDEMAGWHHRLDGCESWIVKKAEHQKIDAFELWCWRRLLRVPWTARRSNQSILKEISPGYSLEGMMLKMKLQYFGHLMQRVNSLE